MPAGEGQREVNPKLIPHSPAKDSFRIKGMGGAERVCFFFFKATKTPIQIRNRV